MQCLGVIVKAIRRRIGRQDIGQVDLHSEQVAHGVLVLGPGEAAEFDTRVPHWFGSTGEGPAEVLSIFGRPGERMLVRASGEGTEPADEPH